MTVNLDHYNGRAVTDVNVPKHGGKWQIVLEGNVKIINYNEEWEKPEKDDLVGKVLQMVTMSDSETILYLGTDDAPKSVSIHLSPLHYGIADSDQFEGVVRPQEGAYIHDPAEDAEEPSNESDESE